MQKTKRQHTVPRCYLERWVNFDTGNISTFDKITKKTYNTSIWNVAQERFFYDLHPEAINPEHRGSNIDLQITEKALAAVEGYFAQALDGLLGRGEPRGIHPSMRWMLAVQVAIQWMRTRRARNTMVELAEKSTQAFADELVRRNYPDLPSDEYPTVTLKEHSISAMHNQFFFNKERWEELGAVFVGHIWMLGVNETSVPFYTSDHPVVRRANLPDQNSGGIGINSPGVEFFMPLSPKYGLLMLERSYFRQHEKYDGGLALFDPDGVEAFNCLQLVESYRHVFSSQGDFATAIRVCEENPAVCDPNREVVEVSMTQVGPMSTRFEARVRQ